MSRFLSRSHRVPPCVVYHVRLPVPQEATRSTVPYRPPARCGRLALVVALRCLSATLRCRTAVGASLSSFVFWALGLAPPPVLVAAGGARPARRWAAISSCALPRSGLQAPYSLRPPRDAVQVAPSFPYHYFLISSASPLPSPTGCDGCRGAWREALPAYRQSLPLLLSPTGCDGSAPSPLVRWRSPRYLAPSCATLYHFVSFCILLYHFVSFWIFLLFCILGLRARRGRGVLGTDVSVTCHSDFSALAPNKIKIYFLFLILS